MLGSVEEAVGVLCSVSEHGDGRLGVHVGGADGLQDSFLGGCQDRIQPEQDSERQDDVAVLVLLVGAAEDVCGTPDEGCVVEHCGWLPYLVEKFGRLNILNFEH